MLPQPSFIVFIINIFKRVISALDLSPLFLSLFHWYNSQWVTNGRLYSEPKGFFSSSIIFCIVVNIDNHFFLLKILFLWPLWHCYHHVFSYFCDCSSFNFLFPSYSFLFLDGPLYTCGKKKKKKKIALWVRTLCWVPNIYNYFPTGYVHLSLIELAFLSFPLLTKLSYLLCYQFQWVTTFLFVKEKPVIKFDSSLSVTSPKFNQSLRAAFPMLFNSPNCPLLSSCSVPALA